MPQPKAIFFDLDETLIENRIPIQQLFGDMYYQFDEELGAQNQDTFFSALREHVGQVWGNMFSRPSSPEEQLLECFSHAVNAVNSNTSIDLPERMFLQFRSLSAGNVHFQPGAVQTLADLREAGFITGVITNGIEQLQLGKIAALEIEPLVDHVTVSAQARAHKPAAPVFQLALSRAGVQAHEAWQVGDNATNDVAGAIRAGMSGVFYDPSGAAHEKAFAELPESPTHVIKHLKEVVDLALR